MTAQEFLENILSKTLDIKEIKLSAENLRQNPAIIDWIEDNQDIISGVSPFEVCSFLQKISIKMVGDKTRNSIIANLYDMYSVMFAICVNQKQFSTSAKNKLSNIFYRVHMNTGKFDMFEKKGMRNRKIIDANNILMELFWLLPFFCKTEVLLNMNIEKYISESESISSFVNDYFDGYMTFVFANIKNIDIPALKQHIHDGAVEYQKSIKQTNQ